MRFRSQVTITTPPIDENEGFVICYGVSNFRSIRFSNGYYCDKTSYIQKLEKEGSNAFLFLRPRRFGKSLFLDTLNCFHNELYKNDYVKLFEGLDIFKMPDAKPNTYMVLNLSFISLDVSHGYDNFRENLINCINDASKWFIPLYFYTF